MYKLRNVDTNQEENIYGVERKDNKTYFLLHSKEYGWSWVDSSYFEPLVVTELGI